MKDNHKNLTAAQIEVLEANGCSADDWNNIFITDRTDISCIKNCRFGGVVSIGACGPSITDHRGVERRTGLFAAQLIDCTVGDNCLITGIGTYIARYDIGDNVIIEDTSKIVCTGDSSFGNGVEVESVNEAGGREVPIFTGLSAQTAYIIAMYRHRSAAVDALKGLIGKFCSGVVSNRAYIGDGVIISGCGNIVDVNVGPCAFIEGASELRNGTVCSRPGQKTVIGTNVIAHDFICLEGSHMTDGVTLNHCFVGEACRLEFGYTATHSMFFANSELGGGEAASVFGGPYTVSHHRSSLLIAGYFLFFNAGSGSNQSNHLFKAGPVHQGIHERGCKFGSNSYIMLPSREGAFTIVIGKHTSHHDTSDLPFSYLMEDGGRSSLHPAANLRSFGTHRDLQKWPARDRRTDKRTDRINQQEYNPYLGAKILRGLEICRRLSSREGVEVHNYNRVRIKNVVLKRGMQLYELAADATVGSILKDAGAAVGGVACDHWVDAAGMYLPLSEMEKLMDRLEAGDFASIEDFEAVLDSVHTAYPAHAYAWALEVLARRLGHAPSEKEIGDAIVAGAKAASTLTEMRQEDALRDMDAVMETGYGIDSTDTQLRNADFRSVRKL